MWSVWYKFLAAAMPEQYYVHLGRGYALLRSTGEAVRVLYFPEDLPMDRILSRVGSALPAQVPTRWKRKPAVHVTLGATVCRPLSFAVPGALQSWQELQLVANAQAKLALSHSPHPLHCELDYEIAGLAGVVDGEVLRQIHDWAARHQLRLVSVAPLWSIASACKAVQSKNTHAIAVHEPEGCTLVMIKTKAPPQATTIPPLSDGDDSSALLRKHVASMDIAESSVLHMYFATSEQPRLTDLPVLWAGHWSL